MSVRNSALGAPCPMRQRRLAVLALAAMALGAAPIAHAQAPAAAGAVVPGPTRGSIVGPTLRSTDLARSARFYTEGLGLTLAGRLDLPKVNKLMFTFGAEGRPPVIMLAQRKDATAASPVAHGDGYGAIVLNVADAEGVASRLKAAGYAPGRLNVNGQTGFKGFMVKDPDGYEFEITERPGAGRRPE